MKMQNALLGSAMIIAQAVAAAGATAGTVSATAPVSVIILAPVTVAATQAMDFGLITRPGTNSNTVSMDATGAIRVTGSGDATHPGGAVTPAMFKIAGDPGVTYSTTQSLTFDRPGLQNAVAATPAPVNGSPGVIPAEGFQEIRVGGAFEVSAATPIQSYAGSLQVTVNYN